MFVFFFYLVCMYFKKILKRCKIRWKKRLFMSIFFNMFACIEGNSEINSPKTNFKGDKGKWRSKLPVWLINICRYLYVYVCVDIQSFRNVHKGEHQRLYSNIESTCVDVSMWACISYRVGVFSYFSTNPKG